MLNTMSTNTEGIQERRRLPPATTMSSVEGVVTRIAAQILHRHDGQQQQQHHDFYHHDAQYYNNYSFFDKGPPPPPAEFGGIIPFIGRMLKLWILTSALLLASATSYITAYHTVLMPPRCATVPLFFECTTTTDMAAAAAAAAADMHATSTSTPSDSHAMDLPSRRFYFGHHQHQYHREKKQQQQEQIVHVLPSSASSSSSSATATVDLFARHDSWEAFHPSVIPPPVAQKRLLQSRQAYYIELSLKLPASNHNQQGAGIFGVHTQLFSSNVSNSTRLATSRRSARFPYESSWIQVIRNILLLPALLLGAMEESRSVTVLSFRHFTESKDLPLQHVRVSIVPHPSSAAHAAAWQHETISQTSSTITAAAAAVVEITGGELRIGKELNRYQEILKGWYFSCFLVGTILFAGFYATLWSLLFMSSSTAPSGVVDPIIQEEPPCDLDDGDDMGFEEAWGDTSANFAEFEDAWENTDANFEDWSQAPAPSQQRDEPVSEVHEDEPPATPEVPLSGRHRPSGHKTTRRRSRAQQSRYDPRYDSQGSWEDL